MSLSLQFGGMTKRPGVSLMKNDAPLILMVTLCLFLVASSSLGREPPGPSRTSESLHALQGRAGTTININNFTVWISGSGAHPPLVDNSWNGTFPKGAGGAIFSEGILWCGFVRDTFNPELRAGGSMYYSANWPGAILTDSTGKVVGAEDPFDPAVGATASAQTFSGLTCQTTLPISFSFPWRASPLTIYSISTISIRLTGLSGPGRKGHPTTTATAMESMNLTQTATASTASCKWTGTATPPTQRTFLASPARIKRCG